MNNFKIIIFDEDELLSALIQNYLKDLTFPVICDKYNRFDESLISDDKEHKIIIVDINKQSSDILEKISDLSKNKTNNFIAVSYDNSTDLSVKALRFGVKDFLLKPLVKSIFIDSVTKIYKDKILNQNHITKIYTASSLEKGNGKSTFLINLAKEVADVSKKKVLLLDLNNSLNDISFLLNIDIVNASSHYLNNITEENAEELLEPVPTYKNSSMYVIANGFHSNIKEKVDVFKLDKALNILRSHYDYIFIDKDEGETDVNEHVCRLADIVFYVIAPTVRVADKVRGKIDVLYKNKKVRVICNKYDPKDDEKIDNIKTILGREIFLKIPKNFMILNNALNNRKTLKEINPGLDIVKVFNNLARYIIDKD